MIRLWEKSRKRDAGDELRSWRTVLEEIDRQAGQDRSSE
jgi:hypothetical protein